MKTPHTLLASALLSLSLLGACGGGGSGGTPAESTTGSESQMIPERLAGIGVAGSMDGRWRISKLELQANPTPRGNPEGPLGLSIGNILRVSGGRVVSDETNEPELPGSRSSIPQRIDWQLNETQENVLRFGLGVTMLPNAAFQSGKIRFGAVLGTLTPGSAGGYVICQSSIRGIQGAPDLEQFGKWRLTLVRDEVSGSAPDFTVKTIDDRELQLSKLRGKVVVLNFWFIDCPPCIAEMPELNSIVTEYENQDVVFLSLALDSEARLRSFVQTRPFAYAIAGNTRSIWDQYRVVAAPTHIVIGGGGSEQTRIVGSQTEELRKAIDSALPGGRRRR